MKPKRLPSTISRLTGINRPNQLPLRVAITDTLTVRASRKRNPLAKYRRIRKGFRLACPRAAQRDYSLFWVDFSICGYRELILRLARTPESRRLSNTRSARVTIVLALWRPLRPKGRAGAGDDEQLIDWDSKTIEDRSLDIWRHSWRGGDLRVRQSSGVLQCPHGNEDRAE